MDKSRVGVDATSESPRKDGKDGNSGDAKTLSAESKMKKRGLRIEDEEPLAGSGATARSPKRRNRETEEDAEYRSTQVHDEYGLRKRTTRSASQANGSTTPNVSNLRRSQTGAVKTGSHRPVRTVGEQLPALDLSILQLSFLGQRKVEDKQLLQWLRSKLMVELLTRFKAEFIDEKAMQTALEVLLPARGKPWKKRVFELSQKAKEGRLSSFSTTHLSVYAAAVVKMSHLTYDMANANPDFFKRFHEIDRELVCARVLLTAWHDFSTVRSLEAIIGEPGGESTQKTQSAPKLSVENANDTVRPTRHTAAAKGSRSLGGQIGRPSANDGDDSNHIFPEPPRPEDPELLLAVVNPSIERPFHLPDLDLGVVRPCFRGDRYRLNDTQIMVWMRSRNILPFVKLFKDAVVDDQEMLIDMRCNFPGRTRPWPKESQELAESA